VSQRSTPMHPIRRPALVVLALALLAAACTGDGQVSSADGASSASPVTVGQIASTPEEDTLSALTNRFHAEHPDPLIDPDEVISGGPPPDGIPPIDEPKFLLAEEIDFLQDTEPVLALTVGDESRAYPVQVMIWHEIVNDTIDGVPVTVTYCPLCNSAIAYDRRLGDRILDFGTSGLLYNSALVMYDRQTETLWSHFTGEAAIGHLTGEVLDVLPVSTVSWEDWREANPDGLVLSRDTGFDRSYGTNPYPGYDDIDSAPFLFDGEVDGRLAAKERVLGIERAGDAAAVRLDTLRNDGVRELDLGSDRLVAWVLDGTTSALDAGTVSDGRDVGATGVFSRVVDGKELSFERTDEGFVDEQTGTTWNVLGEAVTGPLAGMRLDAVPHVDTFWFAWGAFQPDTAVIG
jgi:hypothetical protein